VGKEGGMAGAKGGRKGVVRVRRKPWFGPWGRLPVSLFPRISKGKTLFSLSGKENKRESQGPVCFFFHRYSF